MKIYLFFEKKQGEKEAEKTYYRIRCPKTLGNLCFMCQKCHQQISFCIKIEGMHKFNAIHKRHPSLQTSTLIFMQQFRFKLSPIRSQFRRLSRSKKSRKVVCIKVENER